MPSLQTIAELSRHPITVTILGFVLTGIGGSIFTTWMARSASERDLLLASQARGVGAIHEVIDLINERRTRAVMISSAIRRDSAKEVEARKAAYDDVYVRWNTKEDGIILQIQEIIASVAPDDYRNYIERFQASLTSRYGQVLPSNKTAGAQPAPGLLTQMDSCVTDAFHAYRTTEPTSAADSGRRALQDCQFDRLDSNLIDCTHVITASLYSIVTEMGDRPTARKRIQSDPWTMERACVPPPPPT